MNKTFDEYLKQELAKPITNEFYDPNGGSERAVVTRGVWREILRQYKVYPSRIVQEIRDFDGLDTELGWFIQLPLMIILSPVAPLLAGLSWHQRSIDSYRIRYEWEEKKPNIVIEYVKAKKRKVCPIIQLEEE